MTSYNRPIVNSTGTARQDLAEQITVQTDTDTTAAGQGLVHWGDDLYLSVRVVALCVNCQLKTDTADQVGSTAVTDVGCGVDRRFTAWGISGDW